MKKISIIFYLLSIILFAHSAKACIQHKQTPVINFSLPAYTIKVERIDLGGNLHGMVSARFQESYTITVDAVPVRGGGYCVALTAVDARAGYTEFIIKIDKRYASGSCEYEIIMAHEMRHVNAYIDTISNFSDALASTIFNAANSVKPRKLCSGCDIDEIIDTMKYEIFSHPEMTLLRQRINATIEFKNRQIDAGHDHTQIARC